MTDNLTTPAMPASRNVHVESWGCQMNVADTERMVALLASRNYRVTYDGPESADLILLNTCHIREKARHKVLSRLGVLRELKEKNPRLKIAVAGCVAQAEGKKLLKDSPLIDILLGPGKIDELPTLIDAHETLGGQQMAIGFAKEKDKVGQPALQAEAPAPITGKNEITRYVNIQQGCNNFCTFCVVPFTRGREISRSKEDVLSECRAFIATGAKEIMLLGQNVNSYGTDLLEKGALAPSADGPFVDLMRAVAALPGLERLRFTTSNPHDFTEALARLFAEERRMGRYMHLPVQSGNDRVLEVMRRKVTVAEYLQRINWLRAAVPDIALSTDLIVGFPSETDQEFEDTLALVEQVGFSFIYSFKYSSRKGTAAARFQDHVSESVMDSRLQRLNEVQERITLAQQLREVGEEREVLIQYESKKEPGIFYGRTEHYRLVRVASGRPLIGQLAMTKIIDANKTALVGRLL